MVSLADMVKDVKKGFSKSNAEIVFDPKRRVDFVSSGNIIFDMVSGGGFPRRRISEVFGMEHSCKTAICLEAARGVAAAKGVGLFVDAETAWHEEYANRVYGLEDNGITFKVFQPDNLEEADELVQTYFTKLDKLDLLVFDSVDAMRPKAAIEGLQSEGDRRVGSHAMGMGRLIAKCKKLAKDKNCAIVFINQMRGTINTNRSEQNTGTGAGYNVMETHTTTGGYSLRFYASLRMKAEYGGQIVDEAGSDLIAGTQGDKTRIGNQIKFINIKNKVSTPFLKGVTNFYFPIPGVQVGGFSRGKDAMELLKKRGRIKQVSTKFIYNGTDAVGEVTFTGSKASSEEKFLSDPKLVDDAVKLLHMLTTTSVQKEQVLDFAVQGVDYTDEEVAEPTPDGSITTLAGFSEEDDVRPDSVIAI